MRAVLLNAPGEIVVGEVDDAGVRDSTDAVVRVIAAGICGTDIRAFAGRPGPVAGPACGHEFVGVVEDLGADVVTLRRGAVVVAPFMFADGVCVQCVRGVPTSCRAGGMWAVAAGGAQAEAVRVPFADGTLVPVPVDVTDERIPAVLTLADVMATGPARRYLPELLAEVLAGRLDPSPIFESTVPLTDAARGYRLMADRRATKVLVRV
ncbi:alcohol dehydrogenase catalytic domain-containing protein [Nocardia jiangxiensis]|uniref:Alcohol dehydrogenase catalytic domain-containing protein n=1 Tax=Nocardia jiangxiensis TaxID=282685 RepID=A0ABW6S6D8_9NOCA